MRELRTIDVDKWVPSEKKGMVKHAGMISPYDAFTQLRGHLENMDLMPEEYFSMNPWTWKEKGFDEALPNYLRADCTVHWGGSEGIYMDIALLYRDEKNNLQRMDFATGKTCGSSGDDYLRMSRIAAECSMMLNGRGEIVRFYENDPFIQPSLDKVIADAEQMKDMAGEATISREKECFQHSL